MTYKDLQKAQTYELEDMLMDIAFELHMREYELDDMIVYIERGIRDAGKIIEGE